MKTNFAVMNLSMTLPKLLDFLKDVNMDWENIDELFLIEVKDRKTKAIESPTQVIKAKSICDYIVAAKMGKKESRGLLFYINNLFSDLTLRLSKTDKERLAPTVRRIFTSKNLNSHYPEFLEPIGELAVLNGILKSSKYKFDKIEHRLLNGKGIDFRLWKVEDDSEVLVEVINIHLDRLLVEDDDIAIRKLLTHRLAGKISDKKDGLINSIDFFLVPVIWANWGSLEIYSNYFKRNKMHLDRVEEPMAYNLLSDGNSFYVPRFGRISNLHKSDANVLEKDGNFYYKNLQVYQGYKL